MLKKTHTDSITTFLGADASIEGIIEFNGAIRLDGKVKGNILSENGTVIVGEKAVIEADINVDTAIIMGQVTGVVEAKNRIEVYPPGSVQGDIHAPVIAIDAGVKFNGVCAMKSPPSFSEKKSELESVKKKKKTEQSKIKNFPKTL
jgi:cytoskeletal protein CcmA (bactofilin family)